MPRMAIHPAATRTWQLVVRTVRLFGEIDAEQRAASFAYYAIFSLIPLIALLLSISSMFFAPDVVKHAVSEFIPLSPDGLAMVWKMVDELQRTRGGVGVVSIVILAWSSLKFFQALVRAVNRAWRTDEIPWWQMPLKNLAMLGVIASGFAIGILLPAVVQGAVKIFTALDHFLSTHLPNLHLTPLFAVLNLSRYFIGGAVLFYTITMLYAFAPRRRVLVRNVWAPALGVSIALQVCQIAFVNYLPRFVNYNAVYGAIGLLMLLLIWIYLSGIFIIAGACLCAASQPAGDATPPSSPAA